MKALVRLYVATPVFLSTCTFPCEWSLIIVTVVGSIFPSESWSLFRISILIDFSDSFIVAVSFSATGGLFACVGMIVIVTVAMFDFAPLLSSTV